MRGGRAIVWLGCALSVLSAQTALAGERQFDLTGETLTIGTPCARAIVVTPAAAVPSGHVHIVAVADRAEELANLVGQSGKGASFGAAAECPNGSTEDRTLHVEIQIPGAMPLDVKSSGAETIRIGSLAAKLSVDTRGAIDITATQTGPVDFRVAGSGDLKIGQSEGPVHAVIEGSGNLSIDVAHGPVLDATISGSGDITLGRARFDRVTLESSGSGDVAVQTAWFGKLSASSAGSGTLKIASGQAAEATIHQYGAGDVSIAAAIGRLTLSAYGTGSVTLPHVLTKVSVDVGRSVDLSIGQ